ncbi:MAG: NAD(P)H-hydrate dehydratase [Kiloniellales bacterium]
MTAVLSVAEMRRVDQAAMAGGLPGVALMENAGRAVAEAIRADYAACPVLVLCGPGNNGGDGFVVARCLAAAGWQVRVALLGARESLTGDAAHHSRLWRGPIASLTSEAVPGLLDEAGLVVDALFGAGLSRPLEGAARRTAEALHRCHRPVVAVDVPSGLCGDSGEIRGNRSIRADLCVTFFRKKPGHLLLPGRNLCGKIIVADIGIPDRVLAEIAPKIQENHPLLWAQALPRRRADSHKYDFGHAVVLGGSIMTGAARLAARAALRVGAGLVTLACPRESLPIYARSSPSLIVAPLEKDADFRSLLEDPRKNAVLLGPGNGVGRTTRARVRMALEAGKTVVLDADALTSFQEDRAESLFQALGQACVLTPHEGEFLRLFPDLTGDKLSRARAAARISGAVVVLKGADTVIADPDGRAAINANAPPELATAGSGDVLAGLVLGLLAQGMPCFDAACAAVWLHGQAATNIGPGLIAEDLTEALPKVLQDLAKRPGL